MLRLANGEACVRLLRDDEARGAMLLERLGVDRVAVHQYRLQPVGAQMLTAAHQVAARAA